MMRRLLTIALLACITLPVEMAFLSLCIYLG